MGAQGLGDERANLELDTHVASAALQHMTAGSQLALVASMAGLTSNYAYAAYGASKFGVVGLATTLRYEYEPRGITVSCICPPEVVTPMVAYERSPGNADDISLMLKDITGSLELNAAVDSMLTQLDRGRWLIIPGAKAKAVATLYRFLPPIHFAVIRHIATRELRKRGLAPHPQESSERAR